MTNQVWSLFWSFCGSLFIWGTHTKYTWPLFEHNLCLISICTLSRYQNPINLSQTLQVTWSNSEFVKKLFLWWNPIRMHMFIWVNFLMLLLSPMIAFKYRLPTIYKSDSPYRLIQAFFESDGYKKHSLLPGDLHESGEGLWPSTCRHLANLS